MDLKFAFAVNSAGIFEEKHFGDADQFFIYKLDDNNQLVFDKTIKNEFKNADKGDAHGSMKKASDIINLLKENKVAVMVSTQFGKNIKRINEHFIPIIIYSESIDDTIKAINKHIHWIKEEWEGSLYDYKLFTIKSGILKSVIKKD